MPEEIETIENATSAPEHGTFIKPAWGLTAHIPEGVSLAWGARAIYSWRSVTSPVLTATGKQKTRNGRKLVTARYEPVIDLVWDRMGWSSLGLGERNELHSEEEKLRIQAMAVWINTKGMPAIKEQCRKHNIETTSDGPSALVEHESDGYRIVANPNGSCGYLYIAAWKVVQ